MLMEEENERILQFALQQQQREEERMHEKRAKNEQLSAVQNRVSFICKLYRLVF